MPFVQRNAQGTVVALFRERMAEAQEYLQPGHADLLDFLPAAEAQIDDPLAQRKEELSETDFALIRAVEDIVKVLSAKGIIAESDLHPQLWALIERRQALRRLVQELQAAGITDDL